MENARLISETREALEQQTATAGVLQVINSSPGDLGPVFDAMLGKAMRLCEADYGYVYTFDRHQFDAAAIQSQPGFVEWRRQLGPVRPDPGHDTNLLARLMQGAWLAHVADARQGSDYDTNPSFRELIDISGIRSIAAVALRKEHTLLGAIVVYRREVRPFSVKQVALLQNFAAQAVIAIENARLITELREALEQQTATAEILRVIAGSTANAQPAFDAIAAAAVRLTGAFMSGVATYDGKLMHLAAMSGVTPEEDENIRAAFPIPADDGTATARAILTRQVTHIKQMPASSEGADAAGRRPGWRDQCATTRGRAVHRQTDRPIQELRRLSGHRYGKRAADYRDARGIGTADRHR
jgi:two-component system, NtrC family, sensor kinase